MMNRRTLITGLVSLVTAPAIVRATNIMPVKNMFIGNEALFEFDYGTWTVSDPHVGGPSGVLSTWIKGWHPSLNDPVEYFGSRWRITSIESNNTGGWVHILAIPAVSGSEPLALPTHNVLRIPTPA